MSDLRGHYPWHDAPPPRRPGCLVAAVMLAGLLASPIVVWAMPRLVWVGLVWLALLGELP